ncbi:MAG: putative Small GTP-binding domain protein [Promethearchaeota archaeon]|nr:MAG: putative Small GTP-binding domain protein [Candidatus Lokiarchaeota archaeon]
MSEYYPLQLDLKIIFVGNGGVGKTSLTNAIMGRDISEKYLPTIGSTIDKKEYYLEEKEITIAANLWDLGGQRKFNPLNPSFFRNTDVAMVVVDVSEPEKSIVNLKENYLDPLVQQQIGESIIIIVGNKIDKDFNEKLLKEVLDQERLGGFPIIFTSALNRTNISNLIHFAIYSYLVEMSEDLMENKVDISFHDFLEVVNRSKEELDNIPVNVAEINSKTIKQTAPLKISERREEERELELEKLQFLRERLEDLNAIKEQIKLSFKKNISNVESLIASLKNTPIETLTKKIDQTLEQINFFKDDFELKLNSLLEITQLEDRLF